MPRFILFIPSLLRIRFLVPRPLLIALVAVRTLNPKPETHIFSHYDKESL